MFLCPNAPSCSFRVCRPRDSKASIARFKSIDSPAKGVLGWGFPPRPWSRPVCRGGFPRRSLFARVLTRRHCRKNTDDRICSVVDVLGNASHRMAHVHTVRRRISRTSIPRPIPILRTVPCYFRTYVSYYLPTRHLRTADDGSRRSQHHNVEVSPCLYVQTRYNICVHRIGTPNVHVERVYGFVFFSFLIFKSTKRFK